MNTVTPTGKVPNVTVQTGNITFKQKPEGSQRSRKKNSSSIIPQTITPSSPAKVESPKLSRRVSVAEKNATVQSAVNGTDVLPQAEVSPQEQTGKSPKLERKTSQEKLEQPIQNPTETQEIETTEQVQTNSSSPMLERKASQGKLEQPIEDRPQASSETTSNDVTATPKPLSLSASDVAGKSTAADPGANSDQLSNSQQLVISQTLQPESMTSSIVFNKEILIENDPQTNICENMLKEIRNAVGNLFKDGQSLLSDLEDLVLFEIDDSDKGNIVVNYPLIEFKQRINQLKQSLDEQALKVVRIREAAKKIIKDLPDEQKIRRDAAADDWNKINLLITRIKMEYAVLEQAVDILPEVKTFNLETAKHKKIIHDYKTQLSNSTLSSFARMKLTDKFNEYFKEFCRLNLEAEVLEEKLKMVISKFPVIDNADNKEQLKRYAGTTEKKQQVLNTLNTNGNEVRAEVETIVKLLRMDWTEICTTFDDYQYQVLQLGYAALNNGVVPIKSKFQYSASYSTWLGMTLPMEITTSNGSKIPVKASVTYDESIFKIV